MVSVMTTHPSSMVAHAGGKLCEHLTGTQARYPSIDLVLRYEVKTRPSPRTDFRTMSGVLLTGTQARYPSIDLVLRYEVKTRPSPRTDFRTMSGVLTRGFCSRSGFGLRTRWL
jgi:hypothetical protein